MTAGPRDTVLISTRNAGGIGGMERSVYEICRALPRHRITIVARSVFANEYYPAFSNVRVLRYDAIGREHLGEEFDLYIQYKRVLPLYRLGLRARVKVIIPCGNSVHAVERHFDFVLSESPTGVRYVGDARKHAFIPPPVTAASVRPEKPVGLPETFYFTLFNPYGLRRSYADGRKPAKGQDILLAVADRIRFPIVWGFSDFMPYVARSTRLPANLVPMKNLSRPEITYLYRHCRAYVSFSREEGFGWSVADALCSGIPVFSRPTGVVTIFPGEPGIHLYETADDLVRMLNQGRRLTPCRARMDALSPRRFRRRLAELTDGRLP